MKQSLFNDWKHHIQPLGHDAQGCQNPGKRDEQILANLDKTEQTGHNRAKMGIIRQNGAKKQAKPGTKKNGRTKPKAGETRQN